MRTFLLLVFFCASLTAAEMSSTVNTVMKEYGFENILAVQRQHLNTSHVYTYHVEGFAPGGGLVIYSPKTGSITKILDAEDGMILDADLHWNAKEIVFSWKRKGKAVNVRVIDHDISYSSNPDENYQIYTVNIDGTNLKQITNAPYNNLNACWLPDGGIAFISDRKPAYAYCYIVTSPVLYRMERDGSQQKRLSANYLMDFTPSVLNDGRIIYTRWEYVDRCACPIQSLWTINPDGTNLSGYFKNRMIAPGTFMDANAVPNSSKIFATATNHNGSGCHTPNAAQELGYNAKNTGDPLYNIPPKDKVFPREFYTRFMQPENNAFLLAPLAKSAGGTQKCSGIVFASKDDEDYQKIIETFRVVQELVRERARADMPHFVEPACR